MHRNGTVHETYPCACTITSLKRQLNAFKEGAEEAPVLPKEKRAREDARQTPLDADFRIEMIEQRYLALSNMMRNTQSDVVMMRKRITELESLVVVIEVRI